MFKSNTRIFFATVVMTIIRFFIGMLADAWLRREGYIINVVPWASMLDDLFFSLIWGGMILGILLLLRYRHEQSQRIATMVVQMNHHVRNALEIIELSAWATNDREQYGKMVEAVNMIDWALREVLPGNLTDTPLELHPVDKEGK